MTILGGIAAGGRWLPVALAAMLAVLLAAAPGALAAPTVTTEPPSSLTPHTARVGGTIDPGGTSTDALIEWGPGASIADTVLGGTLTGTGAQSVDEQLLNLTPGTLYSFRLVGQQGATHYPGDTLTFTTPAEPVVTTGPASAIGWNTATIGGTIDPKDGDTSWAVEYGLDQDYGNFDGYGNLPAGTPAGPVSTRITGLTPATTYHYRLVAFEQGAVTWAGADQTLTTPAEQPATDIARAMAVDPSQIVGATWLARPPALVTGAALASPFSGFPLDGGDFAALSTGAADDVEPADQGLFANRDGGGGAIDGRGPGARDVSVLQIGLQVPSGANCVSFAFRFLSEEFPDLANPYNDAFIAELDASTWSTSDSAITAPGNFAFGPGGRVVSVNGLGAAASTDANGIGTRFDHGTAILRASAPITPGPHTLFLSVLDQGDGIVDSAVLIDRLQFTATPAGACAGAVVDDSTPILTVDTRVRRRPRIRVSRAPSPRARRAPAPAPVLGKQVVGAATQGTVIVTPPGGKPAPLTRTGLIPLGSRVDARKGHVRITAANDTGDGRLSGEFYGGVFVITQDRKAPVTTVLTLAEDVGFSACPLSKRARSAAKRKKPGKRFLWGDGKGRFRTTGRFGSATVRGTKWEVLDTCAGTHVTVERGVVETRDFAKHKTISVRAGHSYWARPVK